MLLGLLVVCAIVVSGFASTAGECGVSPAEVPQGDVLRISCGDAASARMNGRTVRLFPQGSGESMGLMPVSVLDRPGKYELEFLDSKGAIVRSTFVQVLDAHYPKQDVTIEKATAALKPGPGEQETVRAFREEVSDTKYWGNAIELPVPGCLTSQFGVQRLLNGRPTGDFHAGLDQRGTTGAPIHAVAPGTVKIVEQLRLRGGTVAIDHGQGLQSIYMHMSRTAAREGAQVSAGEIIGYVGSTGRANGPHLHWTLYVNGVAVNPAQWVKLPAPCPTATKPHTHTRHRPVGPSID